MGTIFGVYDAALPARGDALVAAGFVLYGPITTMVLATDETVTEYELSGGERTVVERDLTIPRSRSSTVSAVAFPTGPTTSARTPARSNRNSNSATAAR